MDESRVCFRDRGWQTWIASAGSLGLAIGVPIQLADDFASDPAPLITKVLVAAAFFVGSCGFLVCSVRLLFVRVCLHSDVLVAVQLGSRREFPRSDVSSALSESGWGPYPRQRLRLVLRDGTTAKVELYAGQMREDRAASIADAVTEWAGGVAPSPGRG